MNDSTVGSTTSTIETSKRPGARARGRSPLAAILLVALVATMMTACTNSEKADKKKDKKSDKSSQEIPKPGTPKNPIAFGYRVMGDPGTEVVVESTLTPAIDASGPMRQIWTVSDKPVSMLFPITTETGTVKIEVTSGTEATLMLVRGHAVNPADATRGLKVVEKIGSVTATLGAPAEIAIPKAKD